MKKIFGKIKTVSVKVIDWTKNLSLIKKILLLVVVIALTFAGKFALSKLTAKKISYQTTSAAKGTLTTSISATGTISSGNSTNITTAASGTVSKVYVINGDKVQKGDKIAELTLDEDGLEKQATAWSDYIDAKNAVYTAQVQKITNDVNMWQAKQDVADAQEDVDYKNVQPINPDTGDEWTIAERTVVDKNLEKAKQAFLAAEEKYKTTDAAIAKAQTKVTSALKDYQEVSSTIYAAADGTVNNLSLAVGTIIADSTTKTTTTSSSSTSTSTTITSQTIGKIYNTDSQMQASVSLTESDIINVLPKQKVILTLDAYSNKSFTGQVLAVDTSGSVSSGVTTYPVTILLDKTSTTIYPNMAVSATIITSVKTDVLLIPSTAITTENSASVVYVLKNNKATKVTVTTGSSDDSNTEITKGLSVGDAVITNYVSANDPSQNNTTSAFSSTNTSSSKSSGSSSSKSTKSSGNIMRGMGGMGGPGF